MRVQTRSYYIQTFGVLVLSNSSFLNDPFPSLSVTAALFDAPFLATGAGAGAGAGAGEDSPVGTGAVTLSRGRRYSRLLSSTRANPISKKKSGMYKLPLAAFRESTVMVLKPVHVGFCSVVWCGVVWCDMVWCGVERYVWEA